MREKGVRLCEAGKNDVAEVSVLREVTPADLQADRVQEETRAVSASVETMTQPKQKPGRSKQNYGTPKRFIQAIQRRLRIQEFLFDFAADADNAKAPRYWTKQDDSLSKSAAEWAAQIEGGWGWLNPEFADIDPWAELCHKTKDEGGSVALLVPAGVGANWFRDHVDGRAHVLLLNGRLCFIEDWATTIDPATLKPDKGPPRFYTSEPLYPKDCICCLFSPRIAAGYEVWDWRAPVEEKPRCESALQHGWNYYDCMLPQGHDGEHEWTERGKRPLVWSGSGTVYAGPISDREDNDEDGMIW